VRLEVPEYTEKYIPITFYKRALGDGQMQISATVSTPKILIDGKTLWGKQKNIALFRVPTTEAFPLNININGIRNITISQDSADLVGTTFLSRSETNLIVISGQNVLDQARISNSDYEEVFEIESDVFVSEGDHALTLIMPKINDSYLSYETTGVSAKFEDCNSFRTGAAHTLFAGGVAEISTTNASLCVSYFSETLPHDLAYAAFVGVKNESGRSLRFWVLNEDEKTTPLDSYLDQEKTEHTYIIPFMEENGDSYSFHFDNSAVGNATSKNILSYLQVYPVPQKFIEKISFTVSPYVLNDERLNVDSVSHPNESLYVVNMSPNLPANTGTLVLSQSYDPGWKAYVVNSSNFENLYLPFIFGTKIDGHVRVNSWENGWILPSHRNGGPITVVIVYIPQYLEYAGFVMLLLVPLVLVVKPLTSEGRRLLRK
jgi:hypothetical protein